MSCTRALGSVILEPAGARRQQIYCLQVVKRNRPQSQADIRYSSHLALLAVYFFRYVEPQGLQLLVEHTQQAHELYLPEWHRDQVRHYSNYDPAICAHFIQAHALWL